MNHTAWIDVPDAPPIPGLRFRAYAGEDDIPAVVEIANAFNGVNGETERWSVEMMRTELRSPTHVRPADGRVLAFVGIDWSRTPRSSTRTRPRVSVTTAASATCTRTGAGADWAGR